jgi:LemA protein
VFPFAWPEPSAAAEIARGQFNLAVTSYNRSIGQFPALIVAWALRLRRAAPLV